MHRHVAVLSFFIGSLVAFAACGSDNGNDDSGGPDAGGTADAMLQPDANTVGITEVALRGRYELPIAADVAAQPALNLVAVSEWYEGAVSLINVSDPANPTRYSRIEGVNYHADVQFKGERLYISQENSGPAGFLIYDVSDPANPQQTRAVGPESGHQALGACHNLWPQPDRDLFYCISSYTGHVVIMSTGEGGVGDRDTPVFLDALRSPGQSCRSAHDVYALGDRLYVAWLCDGLGIYDISDPGNPQMIGQHNYENSLTHNIWPTASGDYVLTTDEYRGGHVRVWDIRDLDNITQAGAFNPNPDAWVHNVEVAGTLAFISHYTDGMYIIDISDPANPVEIAHDDFVPGPDFMEGQPMYGARGNWGIEPALPYVYASSMETGLRIYELPDAVLP